MLLRPRASHAPYHRSRPSAISPRRTDSRWKRDTRLPQLSRRSRRSLQPRRAHQLESRGHPQPVHITSRTNKPNTTQKTQTTAAIYFVVDEYAAFHSPFTTSPPTARTLSLRSCRAWPNERPQFSRTTWCNLAPLLEPLETFTAARQADRRHLLSTPSSSR